MRNLLPPRSIGPCIRRGLLQAAALLCCAGVANAQARVSPGVDAAASAIAPADDQAKAPSPVAKPDPKAGAHAYRTGTAQFTAGNLAGAEASFTTAAALNPARPEYPRAARLTRDQRIAELIEQAAKSHLEGDAAGAERSLLAAAAIDPTDERVRQHREADAAAAEAKARPRLADTLTYAPPVALAPTTGRKNLHLRGDIRTVVAQAASSFGIRTVFEPAVPMQNLRFDLEDTTYAEAMPILLQMTKLFGVAVDAKTLLLARDTEEARGRLERQVEETIYVPGSTPEQLNELLNIVKNVFDVKQVVAAQGAGSLLVRASEPTMQAVNFTVADLLDGGAEVLLDIKLISLDRSNTLTTGVTPPTSAGVFSVLSEAQTIVSANQSLINQAISSGQYVPTGNAAQDTINEAILLILSGVVSDPKVTGLVALVGSLKNPTTLAGVYLTSGASINLGLNNSEARALEAISVRVADRETSTLRVGEKYPITTATYGSGLSASQTAALAGQTINGVSATSLLNQIQTVPQVQFEDLGLTLKTTPSVLRSGLVKMHVDLKVESLTGASLNGIPVLTSRVFTSDITVEDGVTATMLSDLSRTEAASVNGIPGLADLPGLRDAAAARLREVSSSELVLLVTPHLVRRRKSGISSQPYAFIRTVPGEN